MGGFGWPELAALLTSIGYGVVSALVPVANAEVYVGASQVSALAGAVPVAVGVGIGQTIGKCLLFLGVRQGRQVVQRHGDSPTRAARSRLRIRFDAIVSKLLELIGQNRWGLPITFLAAVIGIPPLYAVALMAGATTMRLPWFAAVVLVGRVLRFVLVALGVSQALLWL